MTPSEPYSRVKSRRQTALNPCQIVSGAKNRHTEQRIRNGFSAKKISDLPIEQVTRSIGTLVAQKADFRVISAREIPPHLGAHGRWLGAWPLPFESFMQI